MPLSSDRPQPGATARAQGQGDGHPAAPLPAKGDSGFEGSHREAGPRRGVDRVAHNAAGVHVLDRAQIQRALAGGLLGDVREPQPVRPVGGEVAPDPVVVHRRAGLDDLAPAPPPTEDAPPTAVATDPPGGPPGHRLTGLARLVEEEPVAEPGIVVVGRAAPGAPAAVDAGRAAEDAGPDPVDGGAALPHMVAGSAWAWARRSVGGRFRHRGPGSGPASTRQTDRPGSSGGRAAGTHLATPPPRTTTS